MFGIDPTANGGITENGRIEHKGASLAYPSFAYQSRNRDPAIRRSLVIDDILYTVSAAGVKTSDIANTETLTWMAFPHPPQIIVFLPYAEGWTAKWMTGAHMSAQEHGYELVELVADGQLEQAEKVTRVLEDAEDDPPAAYVWWPADTEGDTEGASADLQRLSGTGRPVIGTGWHATPPAGTEEHLVAYVGADPEAAATAAGNLMLSALDYLSEYRTLHGDRGTAAIVDIAFWGHTERVASIQNTLEAAGVEVLDSVVLQVGESAYDTVENMLLTHENIDVLYLPFIGWNADRALSDYGYVPGQDIMVVGGSCYGGLIDVHTGDAYGTLVRSPIVDGNATIDAVSAYLEGEPIGSMAHPPTVTVRSPTYTPGENDITSVTVEGFTILEACSLSL